MYLIDTDILVYSLKRHPQVIAHFTERKNLPMSISVINYGELVFGAKKSKYVEKNMAKVRFIAELFPIIEVSKAVIESFGELKAGLKLAGKPISDMDLLIASTAMVHNLILVTNNVKHFQRLEDLEIENWTQKNPTTK